MFCINCGKEIPEGKVLCAECEAAQNLQHPEEQAAPVAENVEEAAPVVETAEQPETFQLNNPAAQPVKKAGKRFPVAAVIAAVAVVAIVLTAVLCWGSIESFFIRTFASPEDYLQHVTEKQMEANISAFSGAYGQMLANMSGNKELSTAAKMEMHLLLGDELMSMLETGMESSGVDMDLSWLSDIMISMDTNMQGDMTQMDMGVGMNNTTLLTLSMIMDMAGMNMYMGVPELSDQYLSADLSELGGEAMVPTGSMTVVQDSLDEIKELLPSEEYVNTLLNRYLQIILENVKEVEKDTDKVSVSGVEQKFNVLTATIYEEDLLNIAIAVLEDAKEDEELLNLIVGICEKVGTGEYDYVWNDELGDYEMVPVDVDFEAMVEDGIDEALDSLDELLDDCDDDNYITLTMYVDNSDAICGMTVEISGAEMDMEYEFYYITVWERNNYAFEAELGPVSIEGEGNRKKNLINAQYEISAMGLDVMTIEVIDYDEKQAEDGNLVATYRLTPADDVIEMIMGGGMATPMPEVSGAPVPPESSSVLGNLIGNADLSLQLECNCVGDTAAFTFSILTDDSTLIGFSISATTDEAGKIEIPDKTVDVTDQTAMQYWILGLDFDKLGDNLEKADLPDEVMTAFEAFVQEFKRATNTVPGY